MELKIFSWNIYCNNKSFPGVVRFLEAHEADVMCLQEVPTDVVKKLRKRNFYIAEAKARHRGRKKLKTRNVILSRYPIKRKGGDAFPEEEKRALKSRISGLCGPLEFQFIDIKTQKRVVRIFNSHLECNTSPRVRLEQFRQVLQASHNSYVNVFCGDLNVYGRWYVNLFIGFMSNCKLKDLTSFERRMFDKLFKDHKLQNVFHGHVTYPRFRLQLDHILIPDDIKLVEKHVYKKRYGSDHRPIMAKINLG